MSVVHDLVLNCLNDCLSKTSLNHLNAPQSERGMLCANIQTKRNSNIQRIALPLAVKFEEIFFRIYRSAGMGWSGKRVPRFRIGNQPPSFKILQLQCFEETLETTKTAR